MKTSALAELSSPDIEVHLTEAEQEIAPETGHQAIGTVRKLADLILISLFCLVLLLPLSDMLFNIDPIPSISENRELVHFPELKQTTLDLFPTQFEAYFTDHFGFRQSLIQARSIFLTFFLHLSPSPSVIFGKDGWLFFADIDREYYQAEVLFSSQQLAQAQALLEQDYELLEKCNIHYIVIIAPNKSTIYPEYMPDTIIRVNEQTRLDQVITYLHQHSTIDLIDLRLALRQAKTAGLLYNKTDSHWNEVGAFVAYQEIMPHLHPWFPQLQTMSLADFNVTEQPQVRDLVLLMGLQNVWQENVRVIEPRHPFTAQQAKIYLNVEVSKVPPQERPFALETGDPALPRAVIIHDSFFRTGNLYLLLAEHFRRTAFYHYNYIHQYEDMGSILRREQPNIVIYEVVERSLQAGWEVLSPEPKGSKEFVCK